MWITIELAKGDSIVKVRTEGLSIREVMPRILKGYPNWSILGISTESFQPQRLSIDGKSKKRVRT